MASIDRQTGKRTGALAFLRVLPALAALAVMPASAALGDVAPPPPTPALTVLAAPGPTGVAITVSNTGDVPLALSSGIGLEVMGPTGWTLFDTGGRVDLRATCEGNPILPTDTACLTLDPGATLAPGPWLGTVGDAQCLCDRCGPAPAGQYRFVIRSCDGADLYPSDAFALPALTAGPTPDPRH